MQKKAYIVKHIVRNTSLTNMFLRRNDINNYSFFSCQNEYNINMYYKYTILINTVYIYLSCIILNNYCTKQIICTKINAF